MDKHVHDTAEDQRYGHRPVLLDECLEALNIRPDGIYIDGTLGGAGHSSQIAKRLTTGRLIGIDRDPVALKAAGERLSPYSDRVPVDADEPSGGQPLCDLTGVARATQCAIDINAIGANIQTVQAFLQQNGNVKKLTHRPIASREASSFSGVRFSSSNRANSSASQISA